ncbi:hypothetical protein FRX31_019438 [Thalictrum thalictroides]|uniref:TF-B3 domain-containing protein n=1 Tax=Thalictrum thalictroides TaxID=46969 RepID=A0A7J6W3S4_THATH|nr:hypothetical protein FRX31_019438 [Thalictrum thalictroides]
MGRMPKNKQPSFFKIMFGDFTEKLRLPLAFLKHFTRGLPNEVILEIAPGARWIVKLEKVENSVFFGKGWQGFIDDNAIEFAYLLVFSLFGNSKFYVRIYDKTCCEKERIVKKTCRRKEKQEIVNGKCVEFKNHKGKEGTNPGKTSCKSAIMKNTKVTNLEKNKALDVQLQTHVCKMKTRSAHQGVQTAKPDESGTAVQKEALLPQVAKGYLTNSIVRIRKAITPQQKRAYKAANQFKSDYPFFIIKLCKSWVKKRYMDLPIEFVRTYLPDESKCCEIIDVKGRTWVVKYIRPNFKRGSICGGWPAVRSENDLEEDHVCAFELVDKDNLKLKISVLYP